jgi:hypothetical protein
MAKTGRPTKRTEDIENKIFRALGNGMSRDSASKYAGIGRETLSRWEKKDATFGAKLEEIESAWELRMIEAATDGIAKQPKLAVDLLERRRSSWNKDAQTAETSNKRNTIAPQAQVIDIQ